MVRIDGWEHGAVGTRRPAADLPGAGREAFRDGCLVVLGEAEGPLAAGLVQRYRAAAGGAAAGRAVAACWRPVFAVGHPPGVRPLQFALAALNAQAAHDLALAVVDVCRARGCGPEEVAEEFDEVGDLLLTLRDRLVEELLPGPELLVVGDPLLHLLASWCPDRAHEAAWSAARVLWRLRDVPALAEEFARRTDTGAGLVGRFLLTPCR
ncbi:DUF5995 family protein [Streptomyces sp. NPDC057682]|uniref:DUF5995 family protein n=1 Tax=unclassified Streptomyces TaxID=2593676 RepID=UPI00364B7317